MDGIWMAQKGLQEEIFDKARSILSVLWSVLVAAEPTNHIDPAELVAKGVVQVVEARHCFFTTHRRGKFPDRISALLRETILSQTARRQERSFLTNLSDLGRPLVQ